MIPGVRIISAENFTDARGSFTELFRADGFKPKFLTDCISRSRHGVIRGIHGDSKTWKLVSCLLGTIFAVVVNNDEVSDDHLKWAPTIISDEHPIQLLIPPRFGLGYQVTAQEAIVYYKQSTYYHPEEQFTIPFDDSRLGIKWPIFPPILSKRDADAR